jgi:hypothetical protein
MKAMKQNRKRGNDKVKNHPKQKQKQQTET